MIKFYLGVIFICCVSILSAQNFNPTVLKSYAEIHFKNFQAKKIRAHLFAKKMEYKSAFTNEANESFELISIDDGTLRYFVTNNATGATLIKTSDLYSGGVAGFALSGDGTILGIWDAGRVRLEHQEFGTRITQRDNAPTSHNHATHVAGTMVASGVNNAAKGMSHQASLWASDWNNDSAEMANAAIDGLEVSQHSYGYVTGWHFGNWSGQSAWHWFGDPYIADNEDYNFGFYGESAQEWDILAYNAPDYLISSSAGNDRGNGPSPGTSHYYWDGNEWVLSTIVRENDGGADGYDCISHRSLGKNIITIGAVNSNSTMTSFSSWGPTDDGRVKPDVVALGTNVLSSGANNNSHYFSTSGTSMSGPMVAGSVGLLMEHQEDLHPGQKLSSAMKKALIIHSADDMISGAAGPDYRFGWGLMNTRKAAEIMSMNNTLGQGVRMTESSLFPNDTIVLDLIATDEGIIRATLVWTDVPGEIQSPTLNPSNLSLVNDLDMILTDVVNTTYLPYILNPSSPASPATTGDNFRDNVEMIHVENVPSGEAYTLKIHHKGSLLTDQKIALIISGANIDNCPILAKAPNNVTLTNSYCDLSCNMVGGLIIAPSGTPCPLGSTLQYRVNTDNWSTIIPIYSQSGPEQTISTRCACNDQSDYTSPSSKPVITKPNYCNIVNTVADNVVGSLRNAILCTPENGTIIYDQMVTDSSYINTQLIIDKSLIIMGQSSQSDVNISFDFNNIGNIPGLEISGSNKTVVFKNVNLKGMFNTLDIPIIDIKPTNVLIISDKVQIDD